MTCGVSVLTQVGRCAVVASASPARRASSPTRRQVPSVLRRSEGNSGAPGRVWSSSKWPPHVGDEPAQRRVRTVDQRHHALAGAAAPNTFTDPNVQLAESAW
jgi:hypothetical protein